MDTSHAKTSQQNDSASSSTALNEKVALWDDLESPLAPLSLLQKDSYLDLSEMVLSKPLPLELPLDEPVNLLHSIQDLSVTTPGSIDDVLKQGFEKLGMEREKISNAQQFYKWFMKVEDEMKKMEEQSYEDFLTRLSTHENNCSKILGSVGCALDTLDSLETKYSFVSTKTNTLHNACEQLLADQQKLSNIAESIHSDLKYFNELDRISAKLSLPTLAVTGESFQELLSRIDECMLFMQSHPSYKESAEYLVKFKECLSRALTLIKNYVMQSLEETTKGLLNRKSPVLSVAHASQSSSMVTTGASEYEDAFTLYYGKFRTNAPKIKLLMEQIEQRVENNNEYQRFLWDIHRCYFKQREMLLSPSVSAAMNDLLSTNKQDHCALVRSGCAFMVHVCEDEHQLYGHFFTDITPELDNMLRRLCVSLYDMLRPLIIHVYHLETLAELCSILKTEMIDDHVQNNPEQLRAFQLVAQQMLEDVQERLVYRTNIYIRDDIRGYKPAPGDLAYPDKLLMMEEISRKIKEQEKEESGSFVEVELKEDEKSTEATASDKSSMFHTSPADMHGMWYPAVRRVLVCLSKLYRCIDKTIFQSLSQEALIACVHSLVFASNNIKSRTNPKQTAPNAKKLSYDIDGQLFLIKHLLILREQIAPFHAEFAIREMQLDFTKTKDAAYKLFDPKSLHRLLRANSNNAVFEFFFEGSPEVKEFYIDSKKDVDRQLKQVCEEFIKSQTELLSGLITKFLEQAKVVVGVSGEDGGVRTSLRQQSFATPEVLQQMISQVYRELKPITIAVKSSMKLYLANQDTEHILFNPIKLNVQQVVQQFHMLLIEHYSDEEIQIIACPSHEQIGLLLSTTS